MKHNLRNKGSFTVELTLIFPIIFLIILAVLFMSIVQYQNVITSAVAMQSANRIAAYWQYLGDGSSDILAGTRSNSADTFLVEDDFKERDPYRNLIDLKFNNRKRAAQNYANSLIGSLPTYYDDGSEAVLQVNIKGNFLMPYVEVATVRNYVNPFGRTFEQFGIGSIESRTIRATAPLTNNAEFVRNIDFIHELVEKSKE